MANEPSIIDTTAKELNELLERNKCKYIIAYDFPQYKILPPECDLALKVLERHGIKFKLEIHQIGN